MANERSVQELLQAFIKVETYAESAHKQLRSTLPPLVAVSRFCGAGGTKTAHLLADRLGVKFYDQELVHTITREIKTDKYLMARLDEHVTSWVDDLVHDVFSGNGGKVGFIQGMIRALMVISREGGVVVGRGAHLLAAGSNVFRVRFDGSLSVCAKRMVECEGIKEKEAEKKILETNDERIKFVRKIYQNYTNPRNFYDMVLNSDIFSSEQMVELILLTMGKVGFRLPKK